MKYSVATIATLASAASAAQFLNAGWDVVIGTPFEIKFDGCDDGCTIVLQNGKSTDLKDVETLTATAKDGSFTWTPSDLPTDEYNFKIIENSDPTDVNYSSQFTIEGDVKATSTAETSTSAATSSVESTSSAESTTEVTTLSTVVSTTEAETTFSTPSATHNGTTPAASTESEASSTAGSSSTATEAESSSTATETSASTTVPDSGATRMTSSIALIAGAVMAMVYLN